MFKTLTKIIALLFLTLGFYACQEDFNERYLIKDNTIELEDAITTTLKPGKDYGVLARKITGSNHVTLQVNMFGVPHREDQQFSFRVVEKESTAKANVDYTLPNGHAFTIQKNTNKGFIQVNGLANGTGKTLLVIEITGNDKIGVAANYKRIGIECQY